MKKYAIIFLAFLLILLIPNACVSTETEIPTLMPTHTLQVIQTFTPTAMIYPVQGDVILLSPSGTKKAIYDSVIGKTFHVIDTNGTVMWSITYDSFSELAEPSYRPFYWSKDEKFLYYTCFHGQEVDGSSKYYGNEFIDGCGVFRLDLETGETIDILPEIAPGYGYYAFSISPDEKHLVYTYQNETPVKIKSLDLNTQTEKTLFTADEKFAEIGSFGWSPKMDKLVFVAMMITADENSRSYTIFMLDLKNLDAKIMAENLAERLRFDSWIEEKQILFRDSYHESVYQEDAIWVLNLESQVLSPLATAMPKP